jgi:hypothetical protein
MAWFRFVTRKQHAVVAVVYDPDHRKFLVGFNSRWGGYTFPLRRKRVSPTFDPLKDRDNAITDARQAVMADLNLSEDLIREAHWMDRIRVKGVSGRTKEPTVYTYDIVTVLLNDSLPEGVFAGATGFLSADEIRDSDPETPGPNRRMVTWTTVQVLTRLLDHQQAAVAIVSRERNGVREYLMTRNRYGWFFPATRMGDEVPSERLVVAEFNQKAKYLGRIVPDPVGHEVEMEQDTAHLGPRNYTFQLHRVRFPQEDLTLSGNRLEQALDAAEIRFCWVSEGELTAGTTPPFSNTAIRLAPCLSKVVSDQPG